MTVIGAVWLVYVSVNDCTSGVASPVPVSEKTTSIDGWRTALTELRSMVVWPDVLSTDVASCVLVDASTIWTVPPPLPEPPGDRIDVVTESELQAVMTRPGAAWIGVVEALPLVARLTGASRNALYRRSL